MTTIYNIPIDLMEPEPDEMVTDVMVIARTARFDDDGRRQSSTIVSISNDMDAIVERGLIELTRDHLRIDNEEDDL